MQILDRIKEERERLNYNQTDFAALAKATRKTLFNWESGSGSPTAEALAAWATVGLDVLYVVTGDRARPMPLPTDEQMWLDCYREWDAPVKKRELRRAMGVLAEGETSSAPATPSALPAGNGRQTINAPVMGHVTGGRVSISNKVKNNR